MVLVPSICLTLAAGLAALRARLMVLAARLFTFFTASTTLAGALRTRRAAGLTLATGLVSITGVFTTAGAAASSTFSATAFTGAAAALATASIFSSTLVSSATSKLL